MQCIVTAHLTKTWNIPELLQNITRCADRVFVMTDDLFSGSLGDPVKTYIYKIDIVNSLTIISINFL